MEAMYGQRRQRLYGLGFNGFGQLRPQSKPHGSSADACVCRTSPVLMLDWPVLNEATDTLLGVYAEFQTVVAWTSNRILLWGWTLPYTGGKSDPALSSSDATAPCTLRVLPESESLVKCQCTAVATNGRGDCGQIVALTSASRLVLLRPGLQPMQQADDDEAQARPSKRTRRDHSTMDAFTANLDGSSTFTIVAAGCSDFAISSAWGSAATTDGRVLCWPLSDPASHRALSIWQDDLPLSRHARLSCLSAGAVHFAALVDGTGDVATWRCGPTRALHGQLGYIDQTSPETSRGSSHCSRLDADDQIGRVVEALQGLHIVSVAAGSGGTGGGWHTMAASQDGTLYSFGADGNGQLGHASDHAGSRGLPEPLELDVLPEGTDNADRRIQIACGTHHSVYGQLGRSQTERVSPMQILDMGDQELVPATSSIQVYAGGWNTFWSHM
ncbi:regulator of chromosome condensation 1/beta-lactamase-inhibitor protein II [Entophlyctis helioformis]|nr:regulator of chromosome condensation 1/beta-lactamase-inhibitor protein II [Entophlyctis helioformis]